MTSLDFEALRREMFRATDAAPNSRVGVSGRLVSLNVGGVRDVEWMGERVQTGIFKSPVDGPLALRGVNFDGDDQADRQVHGGVDKAVYAYAIEDYEFWHDNFNIDVAPGLFGENLTVVGISLTGAVVGERWRIGSVELEVAQPRLPCYKLGIRMGDELFPRAFMAANRTGAYLRIIQDGVVSPNDTISIVSSPRDGVTMREMVGTLADRRKAPALLRAPHLPGFWRRVAESGVQLENDADS